jgi:CDP-glucose 4,6-dehydratase
LVRDSYENPKLTFDTNVGGTVNLLEAVRKTESVQAAVIVASDKCYENVEWEYGYREVDPLGGKDPYSASKGAAEIVFHSYVRSFFSNGSKRLGSARAGNVIGGHDWAKDRIIPDCFRAWESGKSVSIRSPHSTRPWQHVLEPLSGYLAQGAALLTNAPHMAGESFNFGPHSDANRSVLELLGEVKKFYPAASWKIESNDGEQKKEARLLRLVCDKAESRLNWSPTLSFSESIQFTVDGYLSQNSAGLNQIKKYSENARGRKISWAND